jgi:hypothetical protein
MHAFILSLCSMLPFTATVDDSAAVGQVAAAHYTICYHTHGTVTKHFECHHEAHEYEEWLEGLGCHVHVHHHDSCYEVCYSCRHRTTCTTSPTHALLLMRSLQSAGFSVSLSVD